LLLVISSAFAHDIYFKLINPKATEANRVMVGRVMVVLAVMVAGYIGVNPPGFVAQVVAFAFGLAAASFFPVILLGIFDRRANREGAIAGMIVGLGFTVIYIVGTKANLILPVDAPFFGNWFFGISAEGIGAVGMMIHFVVALVVSRLTSPPPAEIVEMVELVRLPDHAGPAFILDEATE
jgi:cation/acetate symporter